MSIVPLVALTIILLCVAAGVGVVEAEEGNPRPIVMLVIGLMGCAIYFAIMGAT